MPSSHESKQCANTDLKSSHCGHKAEKSKSDSKEASKLGFYINSDAKDLEILNGKSNKEEACVNDLVDKISSESEKSGLKILKDNFIDKPKEFIQKQDSQYFTGSDSENDHEKADELLDTKATPKVENPDELESTIMYKDKEAIRGITDCSEGGKTSPRDGSDDDKDNSSETANESGTTDDDEHAPTEKPQENDSEIPIVEPNSCTSPVDEAKFIVTVVSETETQFKGPSEPVYPSVTTAKNFDSFLPDPSTVDLLSLDASVNILTNDDQVDEPPREEQTPKMDSLTTLVVSQPSKHPENMIDTGATVLPPIQDVEKPQGTISIYPCFPSLAGPAGESSMGSTLSDSSELEDVDDDDDDNDDTEILEGSVSANSTFASGPADAFDPNE